MKPDFLLDAIGQIDDELILDAEQPAKRRAPMVRRMASLAAAVVVCVGVGAFALSQYPGAGGSAPAAAAPESAGGAAVTETTAPVKPMAPMAPPTQDQPAEPFVPTKPIPELSDTADTPISPGTEWDGVAPIPPVDPTAPAYPPSSTNPVHPVTPGPSAGPTPSVDPTIPANPPSSVNPVNPVTQGPSAGPTSPRLARFLTLHGEYALLRTMVDSLPEGCQPLGTLSLAVTGMPQYPITLDESYVGCPVWESADFATLYIQQAEGRWLIAALTLNSD